MGFPIRKSADQSLFAAPRGLSQRTTSFIASQRQGIHQMPFRHLIALLLDARATGPEGPHTRMTRKTSVILWIRSPARAHAANGPTRGNNRSSLLTMSMNTPSRQRTCAAATGEIILDEPRHPRHRLVEPDGIEPTTSCLQSRRSPN